MPILDFEKLDISSVKRPIDDERLQKRVENAIKEDDARQSALKRERFFSIWVPLINLALALVAAITGILSLVLR